MDNSEKLSIMSNGSFKRNSISSDNGSMEEDYVNIGSPIAVISYDFLMNPQSSLPALIWSLTLCSLIILRIICILMESCDGPNQYYHRSIDQAQYPFLLTEPQYFELYIACFTPILLDSFLRVVLIILITCEPENYPVYQKFVADRTEIVMFVCDVVCVVPFLASVSKTDRDELSLSQAASIVLSIMELLVTGRIFRLVHNIPAIRAVSIALSNSFEHLVLPLFFFFAFNITTGVFFYFAEPCYDINGCPWTSLFQTTFFSIVTMTTTGYGNQTPIYIISRFVAIGVMLFGSMYLSMPLAIIGNEYDKAWNQIKDEEEALANLEVAETAKQLLSFSGVTSQITEKRPTQSSFSLHALVKSSSIDKKVTPMSPADSRKGSEAIVGTPGTIGATTTTTSNTGPVGGRKRSVEEQTAALKNGLSLSLDEKRLRVKTTAVMVIRHSLIDKLHHLHTEYKRSPRHIATAIMIGLCELRAWLPTLVLGIEEVLRSITLFENRIFSIRQEAVKAAVTAVTTAVTNPTPATASGTGTVGNNSFPAAAPVPRRFSVVGRGIAAHNSNNNNRATTVAPRQQVSPAVLAALQNFQQQQQLQLQQHQQQFQQSQQHQRHNSNGLLAPTRLPPLPEAGKHSRRNSANRHESDHEEDSLDSFIFSDEEGSGFEDDDEEDDDEELQEIKASIRINRQTIIATNSSSSHKINSNNLNHINNSNNYHSSNNSNSQKKNNKQEDSSNNSRSLVAVNSLYQSSSMDTSSNSNSQLSVSGHHHSQSQHQNQNQSNLVKQSFVASSSSALVDNSSRKPPSSFPLSPTMSRNLEIEKVHEAEDEDHDEEEPEEKEEEEQSSSDEEEGELDEETGLVHDQHHQLHREDSKITESRKGSRNNNHYLPVKVSSPDNFENNPNPTTSTGDNTNDQPPPNHPRGTALRTATFNEAQYIAHKRSRTTMLNRLVAMLKSTDPELRRRTMSEEAIERLRRVAQNPKELRNRLWILLEFPHSSREARGLQILLIFLICLSIFVMYTQTITSLTLYGESRPICGSLLDLYCYNKWDNQLDPGCFVQNVTGPTSQKLRFNCEQSDCYGYGLNFGSGHTNMTCVNQNGVVPFQTAEQLEYTYGKPVFFTSRPMMQRISPICSRIECTDNAADFYDASQLWIGTEIMMNGIFLFELVLRVAVAQNLTSYVKDIMNLFDLLAILPFFLSIFVLNDGSIYSIDFSILASSPYNFTIVLSRAFLVFRLFKLTRHFRASKVLFETATLVWKQIMGMLALLALMVLLFSIILYELEKGSPCYVGDADCEVPASFTSKVHPGDLIYIGKDGNPSQFTNIFYGVWFSYVTSTTTGYGDIVPVTNGGQIMAIFLMLFGTFYMAMPLTAAATTFYNVHEKYSALGTVTPLDDPNNPNNNNNDPNNTNMAKTEEERTPTSKDHLTRPAESVTYIPSFTNNNISKNQNPAPAPPPPVSQSIMSEQMKQLIQTAIRDLRSFDRLLEELITDLQASPITLFDEGLMRQESRKPSTGTIFSEDNSGSTSVFSPSGEPLTPALQLKFTRKKIARLCKGLEDVLRSSESTIVDLLFVYQAILHGEVE